LHDGGRSRFWQIALASAAIGAVALPIAAYWETGDLRLSLTLGIPFGLITGLVTALYGKATWPRQRK